MQLIATDATSNYKALPETSSATHFVMVADTVFILELDDSAILLMTVSYTAIKKLNHQYKYQDTCISTGISPSEN